ncbi:hypothetical protein GCM10023081_12760 [Arthrobacter ginkgonis]|uniref:DUF559 domain-containing protein n=1 Tax=Arthrobacter ginkgonis TaxID=1630594 RepID=A0ABP7C2V1_9MICC
MSQRSPLPDPLASGAFTVAGAAAVGVPKGRLRAADLAAPYRGLRVPRGVPLDLLEMLLPLQRIVALGVAYRTTAARVHGIPLPAWAEEIHPRIELAAPLGSPRVCRPGLGVRRVIIPDADVMDFDGIRVTTPQRTFADLASLLSLADTVAAGDHLVCAHGPGHPGEREAMMGLEELRRYVASLKGRHGVVRAREAAGLVRVGADSPPETKLRLALAEVGLPEPALGLVVCDGFGRPVLFPDLAFPDYRVAVQYDGGHHLASAQAASDVRRESRTLVLGWKSVVVTRADVVDGDYAPAARRVRQELRRRGWDPMAPVRLAG